MRLFVAFTLRHVTLFFRSDACGAVLIFHRPIPELRGGFQAETRQGSVVPSLAARRKDVRFSHLQAQVGAQRVPESPASTDHAVCTCSSPKSGRSVYLRPAYGEPGSFSERRVASAAFRLHCHFLQFWFFEQSFFACCHDSRCHLSPEAESPETREVREK